MSKKEDNSDYSFSYLNLYTSYKFKAEAIKDDKKELPAPIKSFKGRPRNPCFYRLFNYLSSRYSTTQEIGISLGIFMNADCEYLNKERGNNLVVVDKDTVIRHLEIAKKLVDFEYKLTKRKNYYLRIQMIGNTIQIKFLCAWIRYLYEFPANVLMNDIYRLIDAGKFTKESVFNLIMLLNSTLVYSGIRHDQCIKINGRFLSDISLKHSLKVGNGRLSNLYQTVYPNKIKLNVKSSAEEFSYNYWMDLDKLADRYLIYEKALEAYKKL